MLSKYNEALETIDELSKTAAEEIDLRDAELTTLRAMAKDQNRWKKKLEVGVLHFLGFLTSSHRSYPMPMMPF